MAKISQVNKSKRKPKYESQRYHRCELCGRARSYIRKFKMCRVCFRQLALKGELPGVKKSSW